MSNWIKFSIFCILVTINSDAASGQGCQITGSGGKPVTCDTCDSAKTNCLTCFGGYQLTASTSNPVECVACFQNCLQCTSVQDACTQCQPGYGVDPANIGQCGACSTQNCEGFCDANGPGKCDICADTFGLGSDKLCEPCPEHCKTCGAKNTSYCDVCLEGYTSDNGVCLACAPNCKKCDTAGPGKCDPDGCTPGLVCEGGSSSSSGAQSSVRTTPGGSGGSSTLGGNEGSTTPGLNGGSTTPGGNGGSSTPGGNGGSSTPGGNGGSSTPGGNGGLSTPGGNGGSTTPGGNGGLTTPGENGGSTNPGGSGEPGTGGSEPGWSTTEGSGGESGLSDGAKAGIIIGIVTGFLALLFLCLLWWLCCPWLLRGGRGEYPSAPPPQLYQQQALPNYTQPSQPTTNYRNQDYYPWNRYFAQNHNHGDARHAHAARHLEFSP